MDENGKTSTLNMTFGEMSLRRLNTLCFLFVICLGILCFRICPPYSGDDCYIAYRYAYNIFHHKQYVFNLGERILATTSPLYTLILTGGQMFSDDLPLISNLISFIASSLAGFFIFLVLKKHNLLLGIFCALCFPFILRDIGIDINFIMLLFALSLYLFDREWYVGCGVILGLCFLTRQDSAVFILCMVMIYLLKRKKIPWKEFVPFIVIIAPWFIFSYFYFGSLLPASLQAKKGYASFVQYFGNGFWYLAQYCDRYLFDVLSFLSRKITHFVLPNESYSRVVSKGSLVVLYVPAILLGLIYYVRNMKKYGHLWLIFYVYPILMIVVLSLIGPPTEHRWHLTTAVIFALVGQLNLLTVPLLSRLQTNGPRSLFTSKASKVVIASVGLYLLYFFGLNVKDFAVAANRADESFWSGARFHNYQKIGFFLRENVSEKESIFALEVGTLGYYSRKRMIDGAGLISPGYDVYHRKGCWLMGIEKEFPDYIVAQDMVIPYYEPVFSFENSFGKRVVYKRAKDLPEANYPFSKLQQNWDKWKMDYERSLAKE